MLKVVWIFCIFLVLTQEAYCGKKEEEAAKKQAFLSKIEYYHKINEWFTNKFNVKVDVTPKVKVNDIQYYKYKADIKSISPTSLAQHAYEKVHAFGTVSKAISDLIKVQESEGVINWATPYEFKPCGKIDNFNIEFDHIPPKSASPFGKDNNDFENEGPTVAISNFDHRSTLWKLCSTTGGEKAIMKQYKKFMQEGNNYCAIFSNLYCIKEREPNLKKEDKISNIVAFERYREGFKGLVSLHYDFGVYYNVFYYQLKARASSAYCEVEKDDVCTGKKEVKVPGVPDPKAAGKAPPDITKYYCPNLKGEYSKGAIDKCKQRERNLKVDEYNNLIDWLEGKKTDKEEASMLKDCGLDATKWKALFPGDGGDSVSDMDCESGKESDSDAMDLES